MEELLQDEHLLRQQSLVLRDRRDVDNAAEVEAERKREHAIDDMVGLPKIAPRSTGGNGDVEQGLRFRGAQFRRKGQTIIQRVR